MDKSAFEVLGFLPLVIMGGLSLFLSVPTIVALCTARAVAKGLRMYLLNILMSEILINASAILTGLIALVTVFYVAPAPPSLMQQSSLLTPLTLILTHPHPPLTLYYTKRYIDSPTSGCMP